jgi:solute carrier family 23 (nucleobase transporter), member 1
MATDTTPASGQMIYGIDDVPKPLPKAVGLGLQHVLTMFGATVAVPLLLGPAMGMDRAELAILVSAVMVASGVATFLQVTIGTRLPIIQGVSFAFLGPFFAIIAATAGGGITMQYIAGAIIAGAVLEAVIGYSGLFGVIRRFITPVTIGPVIMLIGLALFTVGAPQAGLDWNMALLVIIGTFLFALVLAPKMGFFKLFPILLAVLVAYTAALALSAVGVYDAGHPSNVTFAGVADAPWFRLWGEGGLLFPWGLPQFSLGFILATLAGYLASMIESFGDYFAVARAAGAEEPTEQQVNRGIGAEGIGCALSGVFGGFSSTSYSENIGLVAITRVASRYVVMIAAGFLVLLGLVAKFGAVVATIPAPIVGGLYCTLFGLIAAIGMQAASRADLNSHRNLLIMGFILFMGLSVPAYFQGVPAIGFAAHEVMVGPDWFRSMIQTIGTTGMAVAAILGIILDNVIPGTDVERGIAGPPGMSPTEVSEFPAE